VSWRTIIDPLRLDFKKSLLAGENSPNVQTLRESTV